MTASLKKVRAADLIATPVECVMEYVNKTVEADGQDQHTATVYVVITERTEDEDTIKDKAMPDASKASDGRPAVKTKKRQK